jgi:hypothetical protein
VVHPLFSPIALAAAISHFQLDLRGVSSVSTIEVKVRTAIREGATAN